MNDLQERKASIIRALAIVGIAAALFVIAWLSIQAVRLLPSAYEALTDTPEEEQTVPPQFVAGSDERVVNSGDALTLGWSGDSVYTFSYRCEPGVAAEMSIGGTAEPLPCDTRIPLPEDGGATLTFYADEYRITKVAYAIRSDNLTRMAQVIVFAPAEHTPEVTPAPTTPAQPVVISTYPVSNPHGYTDLAASMIGVGTYNEHTGHFALRTTLDARDEAAVRFFVKNVGTKTSDAWYVSAELPNGSTYLSERRGGLKPQEREVITILFTPSDRSRTERILVHVTGGNDTRTANNLASLFVRIED